MAHVERRAQGRWRARYRGPDNRERSRTFGRRVDAERFLAGVETAKARGDWTDPRRARVTVGDWSREWLERKAPRLKPSTVESYRSLLATCVLPTWAAVPLGAVEHSDVDAWVARLAGRLGPSRTRKAYVVLSGALDAAVRDSRLSRNPARGVTLPRLPQREHRYLDHADLARLADAAGAYGPLVLVLGVCGLRFGEAAALRVSDLDPLRGRLRVARSVTEVAGQPVWTTPKGHAARSVPLPRYVRDAVAEHVAGAAPGDLVFPSPEGAVLRNGNFRRRAWDRATAAAGLDGLTPHDLRHTAASLAVASGATVLAVSRMLGHKSAAMTLDVYADLFSDDLDRLADRLDAAAAEARDTAASTAASEARSTVVPLASPGR